MAPETAPAKRPLALSTHLRRLGACEAARAWAKGKTYPEVWATCPRPNWLLWLIEQTQPLTAQQNELLVCRFAREVVHLNTDPRALTCIEVRERWAAGEATDSEWDAARAAAIAAAWDAAGDAAWAAAIAAASDAAWDAAGDAAGAAAWDAAGDAARAAAWDTAWDATWVKQCDIIRELIPMPVL